MTRGDTRQSASASLRVALVTYAFPAETFVVRHFLGVLARGIDVHIVCRERVDRALADFPQLVAVGDLGRRVHLTPDAAFGPGWPATAALQLARMGRRAPELALRAWRDAGGAGLRRLALDGALARLRPDVVHFEFGALACGRMDVGRWSGARQVVSFRGYDAEYFGFDLPDVYGEVWRAADAVHVLGEELDALVRARGRPATMPTMTIPPGVDVDRFRPRAVDVRAGSARPVRVLTIARLHWKKGHEYALHALALLRARGVDAVLRIVGEGDHRDAVATAVRQLGLEGHVELVGAAAPEAIPDHLLWADVYLQPSVCEGFGNAVLEAQAAGLPVVCTDATGLRENVLDGVTALVVPKRRPDALANALLELSRDPQRRAAMGRAGRARVAEHFTCAAEAERFVALYRGVVACRRAS